MEALTSLTSPLYSSTKLLPTSNKKYTFGCYWRTWLCAYREIAYEGRQNSFRRPPTGFQTLSATTVKKLCLYILWSSCYRRTTERFSFSCFRIARVIILWNKVKYQDQHVHGLDSSDSEGTVIHASHMHTSRKKVIHASHVHDMKEEGVVHTSHVHYLKEQCHSCLTHALFEGTRSFMPHTRITWRKKVIHASHMH